jgi:hypothetical protein
MASSGNDSSPMSTDWQVLRNAKDALGAAACIICDNVSTPSTRKRLTFWRHSLPENMKLDHEATASSAYLQIHCHKNGLYSCLPQFTLYTFIWLACVIQELYQRKPLPIKKYWKRSRLTLSVCFGCCVSSAEGDAC